MDINTKTIFQRQNVLIFKDSFLNQFSRYLVAQKQYFDYVVEPFQENITQERFRNNQILMSWRIKQTNIGSLSNPGSGQYVSYQPFLTNSENEKTTYSYLLEYDFGFYIFAYDYELLITFSNYLLEFQYLYADITNGVNNFYTLKVKNILSNSSKIISNNIVYSNTFNFIVQTQQNFELEESLIRDIKIIITNE